MKLSYKAKDQLAKLGFIVMIIGFVMTVGYSYEKCKIKTTNSVATEGVKTMHDSIKAKTK
mgnify:CR=1 FL=1